MQGSNERTPVPKAEEASGVVSPEMVKDEPVADWLEKGVARLVRELEPERIVLFGSWARGTATRRSDVDLCVIWRTDLSPLDRIGRVLMLLKDAPRPAEACTHEEAATAQDHASALLKQAERYQNSHALVIAPALKEGQVVYDAA